MEYQKQGESISLVVLCKVEPIFIHIKWMNERGIITGQEMEESVNQNFTLSEKLSVFNIGKTISIYCDKGRFQIECADITAYQRIMDICRETLKMNRPSDFTAVGINAYMDFTFNNAEDALRFGDTFVPLEQWNDIIPNARTSNFTIQENLETPTITHPRRAINVQSLGADKKTLLPVCRIGVNNHYPITSIDEMEEVIKNAPAKYEEFRGWCERLFKEKLA